ncbi:MAG: coproporphyrinogen dehydrogenase HemZ [Clostridiales bacterium]|nr:coproporphyrinogen dehydrogenase HemZ [Clostridiales bacterium]
MIQVSLNRQCFQYDVHSLVRAFYPGEKVRVDCSSAGDERDNPLLDCMASPLTGESEEAGVCPEAALFSLRITFLPGKADAANTENSTRIWIILCEGTGEKLQMESACREDDRHETKNELKRLLYRLLSDYSGRTLPWGNLTGIRPTKIPMALLNQGWKNSAIADYMRQTYYTSNEKTALAIAIANRERYLLEKLGLSQESATGRPDVPESLPDLRFARNDATNCLDGTAEHAPDSLWNGYSLYIGIPFCPSICLYCSFSSSPIGLWKNQVDAYLDTLLYEMERVAKLLPGRGPDTVYIGGGTPTTLEPEQMERLLVKIEACFDLSHMQEFTVEAGRPDSISREKLAVLKKHGITRISINPQTMNQETLDFIGRKHTVEETKAAFYLAREMGFDNINMDLIVGLPGEGAPEVEHTMQVLSAMAPDSITVHSLAVKRAARLRLFREEHRELTFENSSAIMDMTAAYTREAGLHPYYLYRQKNMAGNFENVGYAREGCEGLYNILIMEEIQTILALGAGASTKLVYPGNRICRVENVKDIKNYMDRIDEMIERKRAGLYG